MAKFTKLSFCQKLIFWHKTSSCKCSICLYYVGKVSDSFSKSSDTSWFPHACTIWTLTKALLRSKVLKKMAKFKMLSFCQNVLLWHQTSSCKCSMCLHCVRKVSDGFSKRCGTSWFPRACTVWALTKPLLKSSVKMVKFKTLSFCQKVFLWHQTSSCKCSMCLHYVYKVSGRFSKSCETSWIPRISTTYVPLRITKGNNSNRIGP